MNGIADEGRRYEEFDLGLSEPLPGFNVVWAERWDHLDDCASGLCRDIGNALTADGALLLVRQARREAEAGGWPGKAFVTDGLGRRATEPVFAGI